MVFYSCAQRQSAAQVPVTVHVSARYNSYKMSCAWIANGDANAGHPGHRLRAGLTERSTLRFARAKLSSCRYGRYLLMRRGIEAPCQ